MVDDGRRHSDERIGRYLVGLLDGGTYRPGDALPAVDELARQFGVPAETVLKYLQRLADAGMLEHNTGTGEFIRRERTVASASGRGRIAVLYAHSDAGFFLSSYYGAIVEAVDRQAHAAGKDLLLRSIVDNTGGHPMRVFHELDSEVEGFILVGMQDGIMRKIRNTLRSLSKPCVILGYKDPEAAFETVYCSNGVHSQMAVKALLDAGHRRIGCVYFRSVVRYDSQELNPIIARRLTAYKNAMGLAGIRDTAGLVHCWEDEDRFAAYLERARPTALFCTADLIALKLYPCLKERGYRIPEDITVLGYGGSPDGRHTEPPLATVQEPLAELGRTAVDRVLALRKDPGREPADTLLTATIELRGSFKALTEG